AVADARDAIGDACDCSGAASPRDYATCARGVIVQRVADGLLPSACARSVRACARRSTCGRAGSVACCRAGTKPKCKITTPERCASSGRCTASQSSCCDACDTAGCVTTTTTTTTTPSLCGNGVLEPGENCDDGQPYCVRCGVAIGSQCCEFTDAAGAMCSTFQGATIFSAPAVCLQLGGTRFQWGGMPGDASCPS